jgi:class 3 adenylate cyclase
LRETSLVEPSEEIRRIVDRFTKATTGGDHEAALARLSEHAGTLIIGNDPGEWWHGATARAIWQRQLEEIDGFPAVTDEIEAWEEGTVGWASCKQTITSAGTSFAGRATYVLRLERDEWKIVQIHWSLAKPNVEFLGRTLTTSLEELERNLQLERPDLSGVLAADGTVTIVFTDIVDSTVLLARLGDQDWLRLLRQHHAASREETAAHDGTVVDRQGDGSMLAFSSARRAVSCANSIQRRVAAEHADVTPPLRVRIGIHTGDALREGEQFFGTTVHYAARVAGHALGGEILVSSVVRDLVSGSDLTFLEGKKVELKGIDGVHRLFAVDPESASSVS